MWPVSWPPWGPPWPWEPPGAWYTTCCGCCGAGGRVTPCRRRGVRRHVPAGALWALTRVGGGGAAAVSAAGSRGGAVSAGGCAVLRPLWEFWADVAGELARLLRLPLDFAAIRQKNCCRKQKGFHSAAKYAILNTYRWKCFLRPKDDARKGVRRHGKKQEKKLSAAAAWRPCW